MSKILLTFLFMLFVASNDIFAQIYQYPNQLNNQNMNTDSINNEIISDEENVKQIIPASVATIKILDKQIGRVKQVDIPINESYSFENLKVSVKACYNAPEYETPESSAFIIAYYQDSKYENEENVKKQETIFSGWMFSSSPSLSSMEHPIYDIWVIGCK